MTYPTRWLFVPLPHSVDAQHTSGAHGEVLLSSLWFPMVGAPRVKSDTGPPSLEGRREQDRGRPLQAGRGQFNQQRAQAPGLSRVPRKMSGSRPPPTRILKVYGEALVGFSHMYHPDGLRDTLFSQGCILENGSSCGNSGRNVHAKDKGGRRGL